MFGIRNLLNTRRAPLCECIYVPGTVLIHIFESLLAYTQYGINGIRHITVLSQLYVTLLNGTAPGTFTQIETVIKPYPTVYLRAPQQYGSGTVYYSLFR